MDTSPSNPALPPLLLLLSASTGLVDAISIIGLGKVFTANMTGNVVFLGFAAAGLPGFQALSYVTALVAFLGGAAVGGTLGNRLKGKPLRNWLMQSAVVEAILFAAAGTIASSWTISAAHPDVPLFSIIALTAVAMGFRNATVRQLKVPDLTTTVLTLTLTGLAADSSVAGGQNPNIVRRLASVVAIFAGAVIGALLVSRFGLALPLYAAGLIVFVGTASCAAHPAARALA